MKILDNKLATSLYLHGENLNPDEISKILGTIPSEAYRKGDKRISPTTGQEHTSHKQGFWSLVLHRDGAEIIDTVTELLSILSEINLSLATLPNVQDAYFDVFIIGFITQDGKDTFEFALGNEQLAALARFGIPIRVTTTMLLPSKNESMNSWSDTNSHDESRPSCE
jgi:hypothetical protein